MNPLEDPLTVKTELYDQLEAKSIDCKETIKVEIKQEIQETEDVQDPLSTEVIKSDLQESVSVDEITIEEFKIEDNV